MLRVVLDTSVIIAAARSGSGASSLLLKWWLDGRLATVVSLQLVFEYEAVLKREISELRWSDSEIEEFLDVICARSNLIEPHFKMRPLLADADDEFVMELAFAGAIDYLVTHNLKDFAGCHSLGIDVVTPAQLVSVMKGLS